MFSQTLLYTNHLTLVEYAGVEYVEKSNNRMEEGKKEEKKELDVVVVCHYFNFSTYVNFLINV